MPRRALLAGALAAIAVLPAAAEAGRPANPGVLLPVVFEGQITTIKQDSQVAVLMPTRFRPHASLLYPTGGPTRRGWSLQLASAANCGGASACFIAAFTARRARSIGVSGRRVQLRGGRTGVFRPLSCGASCAPASIAFRRRGVRYAYKVKGGPTSRRAMIGLANSALAAGPR